MKKIEFTAIGTYWDIDILSNHSVNIEYIIKKRVEDFEQLYSRFREDSFLNKVSANPGKYILPDDAKGLLDLYFKLNTVTAGKFTPLIGQSLEEAGYDKKYSFIPKNFNKLPDLRSVIDYSFPNINIKQKVQLDFGAAGKGYIIGIIGKLLRSYNIMEFTINAGGDILNRSFSKTLKIGLENPMDTNQVIGVANIKNTSLCGSAGNRRKWENFHHIIDPVSLKSPSGVVATWVVCPDTAIADALATCLFFVNPNTLSKDFVYDYVILFEDLSVSKSSSFPGELFSN